MALDERLMKEVNELANYLVDRLKSKDTHYISSIAKCPLLSTRRDVSLMDEAFAEYLTKIIPICTPEKHIVKVNDVVMELPKLLRCGEALILPKLMLLRDNALPHVVEALLISAVLNTDVVLNYLSRHTDSDITEGPSIVVKPEQGRELLTAVLDSLKGKPPAVKTLSCNKCVLRKSCPYSYLGEEIVLPENSRALINELLNQLMVKPTKTTETSQSGGNASVQETQAAPGAKPSPPAVIDRDSVGRYLNDVVRWAREHGRVWVSVGVGRCPICGREGVVVVRVRGEDAKVLYRHGKSTCTVGPVGESIDRVNITRFYELTD
ncbi:hypothetical protein [Vulcanisaeta thermophila]|uniref:hypothetical protein n=1 Tax=Vulcanisaeta thermophila TaxID=867917 RepID=UPI000853E40F|nr:hypothetical protein [Vulcanisaeta thermophila]